MFRGDHRPKQQRLVYRGHAAYLRGRFKGLKVIVLEANNTWDAIREGDAPTSLKSRIIRTHMSLDTVKGFLRANDLSLVTGIWLLHLSDDHSDAERFRTEIQELTDKPTYVA